MEQLEQLYDLYISNGLLSSEAASLEEFSNASREQQALLFQLGSDAGLFGTTTFEQFGSAFVKKKTRSRTRYGFTIGRWFFGATTKTSFKN